MAVNQNGTSNTVLADALNQAIQSAQTNTVPAKEPKPETVLMTAPVEEDIEVVKARLFANPVIRNTRHATLLFSDIIRVACMDTSDQEEKVLYQLATNVLNDLGDDLQKEYPQEHQNAVAVQTLLKVKQDVRAAQQAQQVVQAMPAQSTSLPMYPVALNMPTISSSNDSSGSSGIDFSDLFTLENGLKLVGGLALGVGVGYGVYHGLKTVGVLGDSAADFHVSFDYDI